MIKYPTKLEFLTYAVCSGLGAFVIAQIIPQSMHLARIGTLVGFCIIIQIVLKLTLFRKLSS